MDKTPPKSNSEIAKEVVGSCPVTCFSNISYREWRRDQGVLLGIIEKALDEKDKELESELARLREALSQYGEHDKECILSQQHAGRPKENGGYECLYGYGKNQKWYDSENLPPCECGFSKALAESGEGK